MIYLIEIDEMSTKLTAGTRNEVSRQIGVKPGYSFEEALEDNSSRLKSQHVFMTDDDALIAVENDQRWQWLGGKKARDLLYTALTKVIT